MYRSQDRGDSWEKILQTNARIRSPRDIAIWDGPGPLAVDPEDPDRVAVAANEGVHLTEDQGETWSFLELRESGPYGESPVRSVAIQPTHPKRLLATRLIALYALELPAGSTSVSPSTWGRIKARVAPLLPRTSK